MLSPTNAPDDDHVTVSRSFTCRCGQPVFFRNSVCLACKTQLGYDPTRNRLIPLEPLSDAQDGADTKSESEVASGAAALWRCAEPEQPQQPQQLQFARCDNLDTAAACNWLLPLREGAAAAHVLCLSCRLSRKIPDLSLPNHAVWWGRIETAKRRMLSSLIGLRLPVVPLADDAQQGLAFDVLTATATTPVVTGHEDGVITLDAQEADDPTRELRRTQLLEPYRTLLGHLRHEMGHYYWRRLVEHGEWIEPFRSEFGDERADYAAALKKHYDEGAAPDWSLNHVSAYASSHPWEDWAETWAHYLHMTDTLDTAKSFGVRGDRLELVYEPFDVEILGQSGSRSEAFLELLNQWMQITGVLNELSRSMGVPDFYPFVLSAPAVRKLHLVHRIIGSADARWNLDGGYLV